MLDHTALEALDTVGVYALILFAAAVLAAVGCIALLYLNHFSIGSVVSVGLIVTAVFGAIPMSVSNAVGTILQGITAGETLRREGIMPPVGDKIRVPIGGPEGTVAGHALRHIALKTGDSTAYVPNTALLAGFETLDKETP